MYINGHEFEVISERFNYGDGVSIEMPPCYVIDGETVSEKIYYQAMAIEMKLQRQHPTPAASQPG